ncbi:MAG: NAD+ synthase [Patescibacteria group bacterium]|nr:NAD+ synthase [Patescibacteria group bacterium]
MPNQVDLSINLVKTSEEIVSFIKTTFKKAGFSKAVIGLSGGVDSTTSLYLGVEALGSENIYVGLFPYGGWNREDLGDAKLILRELKIPTENIILLDIKPLADKIIAVDPVMNKLRRGNIMVRVRMILLYDLAKKYNSLVLGTENKTEYLLGYFTRFGDEASDIEPLMRLYKTQVRQLAGYLKVPEKIIQKAPTASMWQGQTDEEEFGFTYEEADKILHLYIDRKKSIEEVVQLDIQLEIINKVIDRLKRNEFKHNLPHKF